MNIDSYPRTLKNYQVNFLSLLWMPQPLAIIFESYVYPVRASQRSAFFGDELNPFTAIILHSFTL